MKPINRKAFFAAYRAEFGRLTQPQVDGLNILLAAVCATQHVTNRYWRGTPPECFHHPSAQPRNRRSTDRENQEECPR